MLWAYVVGIKNLGVRKLRDSVRGILHLHQALGVGKNEIADFVKLPRFDRLDGHGAFDREVHCLRIVRVVFSSSQLDVVASVRAMRGEVGELRRCFVVVVCPLLPQPCRTGIMIVGPVPDGHRDNDQY
eukprot:2197767-Rhodomonas_salina.1